MFYEWVAFDHVVETTNLLLLYVTRSELGYIIPKRAFPTADELANFRSILESAIQHRTSAFPISHRKGT
jgi:hypothetical protein